MRLSLRRVANVAVVESCEVGNPGTLRSDDKFNVGCAATAVAQVALDRRCVIGPCLDGGNSRRQLLRSQPARLFLLWSLPGPELRRSRGGVGVRVCRLRSRLRWVVAPPLLDFQGTGAGRDAASRAPTAQSP